MKAHRQSPSGSGIGRTPLFAMAAACGIAVANLYYNQPMLGLIEADFHGQPTTALIPTATQLGYALGLFFLVPLGDLVQRRKLIVVQFIVLAVALAITAMAPSAGWLVFGSLIVGVGATVASQIVPFAATLAMPERRGAAIGTVMAGLLTGILLSRTLSGFVGEHAGWREMFWLGVPLALIAAGLMFVTLPVHRSASRMRYLTALKSLAHLWNREPLLRTATMVQAALFGAFSAFWTILALYLQSPHFKLGADVAGLFGIVGAVGIFAAPLAGRIADRRGPHFVVWIGATLTLVAWVIFGIWGSLIALIAGVIILDFGAQSALVSNQHIIYALDAEARSRLNTVFMTGMFLGGATGSALATIAWQYGQWPAVCILGGLFAIVALCVKALSRRTHAAT
ncbi:MFS transporter [Phyllobacterium leguminum]|uniref:Putative MFS family arabinose efflux permease n=1 Tax=Phyllobacterium leguminum TaxID=314237 RepID=A0A318T7A6_9HYPH|nr:MFS transporter [Phyllobacterium leguminum]PYE90471.1 putative MFS family arabinose efflux permease [Phyllobacterium leguminum]